jgi:cell division protein ZapA (FtsZ GTPase activity inhibitor)
MKTQLKIQMLGSSFSIQSTEPKEHLEEVLLYLNEKIEEVREKNARTEPVQIALLAALNLVDELVRLKKQFQKNDGPEEKSAHEIDTITRHLIEKIDLALNGEEPV